MTNDKRKIKTVSFDVTDPGEKEILDYVEKKGKFSPYVKRLLFSDMRGEFRVPEQKPEKVIEVGEVKMSKADVEDLF